MLDEYIIRAIIAIILLSINASLSGSFTIFKNIPFLIACSAHSALAGASLFIAISLNPIIGAIIFAIFVALIAGRAKQVNIAIGISFAFSMAIAVLFISLIREQAARVWGLLFGDLLLLTDEDIFLMAIMTVVLLIIYLIFYREFLFISFDMEGAMVQGINVKFFNYLLLSIISISTVIIMKAIGAILVYAMLVAPAGAANKKANNIMQVFIFATLIAMIAGFLGLIISFYFPFSPSAISGLIATSIYFILFMK